MKNRQGQALIIVVIIIAVIMAVFANSLTTRLRYHTQEETEIYQREQALYLAEMGINQMIFKMNNKPATRTNGYKITGNSSGIGSYETTYYTPDGSGFGGSGYIESTGTVGDVSRKVFVSIVSSSDAFKYCLYTASSGCDGISHPSSSLHNFQYRGYTYNSTPGTLPSANLNAYKNIADSVSTFPFYIYTPATDHKEGELLFFDYPGGFWDTLILDFGNYTSINNVSIATNYPNVIILVGANKNANITWTPASKTINGVLTTLPIIVHSSSQASSSLTIAFSNAFSNVKGNTLNMKGFIFSSGNVDILYGNGKGKGKKQNRTNITGELMAESVDSTAGIAGDGTQLKIKRRRISQDYYKKPPPYFIVPNNDTTKIFKMFPGSFREEY